MNVRPAAGRNPLVSLLVALSMAFAIACSGPPSENDDPGNSSSVGTNNDCTGGNCVDMGIEPCGGCTDPLVCDEDSGECVECLVDQQCAGGAICDQVANVCACPQGTHECDKACVPDDAVGTCGDRCQPCPGDPNGEAVCNVGVCELECDEGLAFDPASNSCVECATSNDCIDPTLPVCDEGFCSASCTDDDDCAGREATPICNTETGACVECSAQNTTTCGQFVCDSNVGECTDTLIGSLGGCQKCQFDAECADGFACVRAEFQGSPRADRYCYAIPDPEEGCPGGGFSTEVTRTSTQGDGPETFCSVNESLTTCEAFQDYGRQKGLCSDMSDCGVEPDDALCEPTEFSAVSCTYLCDTTADCPPIFEAGCTVASSGFRYCGAY